MTLRAVFALALPITPACAARQIFTDPLPDDGGLPRATPSAEELARYASAAAWSEEHGGVALVVVKGDAVVFEHYAEGVDPATPWHLFSGTKSFSCPLVLMLEAEGRLSLDEPVIDTLPGLAAGPDVRIRHLLDFTSGVKQDWWNLSRDAMLVNQRVADKVAHATALPATDPAGERFVYGGTHQWLLTGVLQEKLGTSALQAMEERLFEPIGFRHAGWHADPSGHTALPFGAWTTALEWAEFGVLMRDDGLWKGERVFPEGIRDRCFTGSAANPAYGLTFWLNQPLGEGADLQGIRTLAESGPILGDAPSDLAAAAGHQDQRLYILPSQDLVVSLLSRGHRRFVDADLISRLLP